MTLFWPLFKTEWEILTLIYFGRDIEVVTLILGAHCHTELISSLLQYCPAELLWV